MKVHYELAPSLPAFRNAVLTIGTFDGVHKGHQKIIQQLKETATAVNGETVIITFHPHPRKIVSSVPGDVLDPSRPIGDLGTWRLGADHSGRKLVHPWAVRRHDQGCWQATGTRRSRSVGAVPSRYSRGRGMWVTR
ncbi:MAG: hypothetical protein EB039_11805 [Proteobacteria bacterium]|nr:hypothetical protein [Pseudomonadota bacterium]